MDLPTHAWAPVAQTVSSIIVTACTAVSHTTLASRRGALIRPSAELAATRRAFAALDLGDVEARRANRRTQRRLVREWHTRRFSSQSGLRSVRFRNGWKALSFVQLHLAAPPTCDRDAWRLELRQHWQTRFGDSMDDLTIQGRLCANLFRTAGNRTVCASVGEVVVAVAGGGAGAVGGLDGPVNEMLQVMPWSFVCFLCDVFNRRFQTELAGYRDPDAWRTFLATWIRKDTESDLLSSFRPIMQSSVLLKCIERLLVEPAPMQLLLGRAPFWGFALVSPAPY